MENTNIKTIKYNIFDNGKFLNLFEYSITNRFLEITINAKPTRKVTPGKFYKLTGISEGKNPVNTIPREGANKGVFLFEGIFKARYGNYASNGILFEICSCNTNGKNRLFGINGEEIISLHEVLEIKEIPLPFEYVYNRRNEVETMNTNKAV